MKQSLVVLLAFGWLSSGALWAQSAWYSYPNNTSITIPSSGNVGIGTVPATTLDANGVIRAMGDNWPSTGAGLEMAYQSGSGYVQSYNRSSAAWTPLFIGGSSIALMNGNVGIGNSSPEYPLEVGQQGGLLNSNGQIAISKTNSNGGGYRRMVLGYDSNFDFGLFDEGSTMQFGINYAAPANSFYISSNGYVGIGTTGPQQLLDVHGTMAAQEVIVSTTGADYVFEPNYRLPALTEVAAYIADHHHLPDIPSAAEMKEKGVGVADMQAKLLAKIEELTLHMIQSEKENHDLRERISRLEAAAGGREAQ